MSILQRPAFFPDIPVLGALPKTELKARLIALGEAPPESGDGEERLEGIRDWFFKRPIQVWEHTSNQIGYLAPFPAGTTDPQPILYPTGIEIDSDLQDARINIHLDRLHAHQYPGSGMHHVMLTFKAQNQLPNTPEPVSFCQTYRVRDGQSAGVTGYPLCIGLSVGKVGAAFQFLTVNVRNDGDKAMLDRIDSPAFTGGLSLLTTVQPALKPFTDLALGVARNFLMRNENCSVQDCYLGLDFTPAPLGARLAVGNYVCVQVPSENDLPWEEWEYRPQSGVIGKKGGQGRLEYNYLIFRVTRYAQ
jgi:hypothetical protein